MIDFPNSPTVGQTYTASNGISYIWNGTLWLTTSSSGNGGDFFATGGSLGILTTDTVLLFNTVLTGNSGNWYNPANGRFTPPAGRYKIWAGVNWYSSSGAIQAAIKLRKNGVVVGKEVFAGATAANIGVFSHLDMVLDANGTDYFDIIGRSGASGPTPSDALIWFGAFPISGIKGPPGDPGQLGFRLLQRTVVSSAVASVDITGIPSDINDIEFSFDLTPTTNSQDFALQFYDSAGALDTTALHYTGALSAVYHTIPTSNASLSYGQSTLGVNTAILLAVSVTNRKVGTTSGIRGRGRVPNIRASRVHSCDWQSNYLSDDATLWLDLRGSGQRYFVDSITGLRLWFTTSTIAAGGTFSVWGSP